MQRNLDGYRVRVFAAHGLKGTTASVYPLQESLPHQEMQRIATGECEPATCFLWAENPTTWNIHFFNPVNEIQVCGHGLLASTKVVAKLTGLSDFTFNTQSDRVKARYDAKADRAEIAFTPLQSVVVTRPAWLTECFNTFPIKVAQAGPDNGYWVMQWPEGELQRLEVNSEQFAKHTQRALIATQLSTDDVYDYYFRYFAPQHGVIEDKATGSAQRVLTCYWSKVLNQCNVKARQYSKEGAELFGRIENGDVWISGNVDIER